MKNIFPAVLILISSGFAACGNSSEQVNVNKDSSNGIAVDCMPVMKPVILDSAAIVKTPPTKDSMAVTQDSIRRHR